MRGSYELPIEQIKQTVNANHGQPVSQLASQPTTLPASQPPSQPANQSSESVSPVSQPTDQPIEQTTQTAKAKTNQLTSQPASQRTAEQTYITTSKTKAYDPPCLAYFIVMNEWRQKVALNSLKFGYVQVETHKFPRPCTLACTCKIIWVSDSGQFGGWSSKFRNHSGREAFKKIVLNFIF